MDGYVRVTDLAMHARQRVASLTTDRQHPILDLEQADNYVVAYYAAGANKLARLPDALAMLPSASLPPPSGANITPSSDKAEILKRLRKIMLAPWRDSLQILADDLSIGNEIKMNEPAETVLNSILLRADGSQLMDACSDTPMSDAARYLDGKALRTTIADFIKARKRRHPNRAPRPTSLHRHSQLGACTRPASRKLSAH
ncbi:hypothetical protein [Nonomuraea sp. NPDC049028]|uniref:hypothetical protein n=1 Tax=Nonomuraea sp. NPDC049028 TaxID=3364348 RepID=UPI0037169F8E